MMEIGRNSARGARFWPIAVFLTVAGCGQISLGGGMINDAVPTGTVVAQGTLASVASGKTVTGSVTVYLSSSTYTVRVQGLSAPSESSLFVRGVYNVASGSTSQDLALRSTSGNQNYVFSSVPAGSTWVQVKIRSATNNLDYGLATLTQVLDGT
jgi:hypothetical protein